MIIVNMKKNPHKENENDGAEHARQMNQHVNWMDAREIKMSDTWQPRVWIGHHYESNKWCVRPEHVLRVSGRCQQALTAKSRRRRLWGLCTLTSKSPPWNKVETLSSNLNDADCILHSKLRTSSGRVTIARVPQITDDFGSSIINLLRVTNIWSHLLKFMVSSQFLTNKKSTQKGGALYRLLVKSLKKTRKCRLR